MLVAASRRMNATHSRAGMTATCDSSIRWSMAGESRSTRRQDGLSSRTRCKWRGNKGVELFLHCSEHCRVDRARSGYAISQAGKTLFLSLPQAKGASTDVYYGTDAPHLGLGVEAVRRKTARPDHRPAGPPPRRK